MTLNVNGKEIILRGDPTLTKALVSANTMRKLLEQGNKGMMIELCHAQMSDQPKTMINPPSEIQPLLREFEIFL